MQIQYRRDHLSISRFDPVELPDFVVLTGVNGSGKSHLLEAIENRNVAISGHEQSNIVLFNYQNFRLENESAYTAQQIANDRDAAWQFFEQQFRNNARNWRNKSVPEYEAVKEACKKEQKGFLSRGLDAVRQYRNNVRTYFSSPALRNNHQAQSVYSLAKQLPFSIDEISRDEFDQKIRPYVLKNGFLPQQLGKVFWDYFVKYRMNQVNQFQNERFGKKYAALTEEEFIAEHGPKPWEVINGILSRFDTLHYKVASPEGEDPFKAFQLNLIHTENSNLTIDFNSLSSGEKILMALVASIYKASSDGNFPDILLLDEVDASLHPSMMKNMLSVIEEIFLQQGMKVFLVTHSPTTIALAPEESVFVMNRSGASRIEKKPKQKALAILTQGYATLEEGLTLFDQISQSDFTIITEGNNANLIRDALRHQKVDGVSVLAGVEGRSGAQQLKTLFDFFCRTDHNNQVLFVWDCDVGFQLQSENSTHPFIFPKNDQNSIAKKGIENLFAADLFDGFQKKIELSTGETKIEFDDTRKRDFEQFVLKRNNPDDYRNFSTLAEEIKRIKLLQR